MHNEIFTIGPVTIRGYGLMIAIGIIAAIIVGMKRADKYGLDKEKVFDLGIVCMVFGLLGAKILYVIVDFKNIMESNTKVADIANGFVVYGGLIGGSIAVYIYCRTKKIDALKYFDLIVPSVSIGQGFGRIGCFLAGCCYGRGTDSIIGITFTHSEFAPNGVKLLPTQLISSAGNFAIAIILIIASRHSKTKGSILSLYFLLYGVGRIGVEFLRADYRGKVGSLTTSEFLSIFFIAAGIIVYIFARKLKAKTEESGEETI